MQSVKIINYRPDKERAKTSQKEMRAMLKLKYLFLGTGMYKNNTMQCLSVCFLFTKLHGCSHRVTVSAFQN